MECVMSACKTKVWKIRGRALEISEETTTKRGGEVGVSPRHHPPTHPIPPPSLHPNSADAVETSKRPENKEGSVFFFPTACYEVTWQMAGERKPEVSSAAGGTSSTATDVLILSSDTRSVSQSAAAAAAAARL